jgi:riboflavin transporter FmnP
LEKHRLRLLIIISILSSLSFILMLIKFPIPFLPPYLTVDFSDIPAFIGFMLFGGMAGALIIILKIIIYGLLAASEPIGPIANMLASFSLLLPIYFVYMRKPSKKSLIIGFILGTLALTIMLAVLNYFILLPMYGLIIDQTDIVNNLRVVITAGIIPFNLVKGILFSLVAYIIYIKLLPKLRNL